MRSPRRSCGLRTCSNSTGRRLNPRKRWFDDDYGKGLSFPEGRRVAWRPLAERGCVITALDIGADMVALARQKLAQHPFVQVVVAAFEDWPLPAQAFDVVVSATAFHWLHPAIRV